MIRPECPSNGLLGLCEFAPRANRVAKAAAALPLSRQVSDTLVSAPAGSPAADGPKPRSHSMSSALPDLGFKRPGSRWRRGALAVLVAALTGLAGMKAFRQGDMAGA